MLGRAFVEVIAEVGQDIETFAFSREDLDVTEAEAVRHAVALRPDVILHCAALVDADRSESEPALARAAIVDGTKHVAQLARAAGARVVYPQSFLIFDGREQPVTEETVPAPVHVYGNVKLEAERSLMAQVPRSLVVRMAGFFGGDAKDKNFVGKFVRQLESVIDRGGGVDVGDRVWQPTYTLDLARNTLLLVALGREGIYNMASLGEASFYDVACVCVDELGLREAVRVHRVASTSIDANEEARRPRRLVMANARLQREGLCRQRPWEASLREYLRRPYFDRFRRAADG
jgi:dTDP-4-dehydrorhamnose reductase